MGGLLSEAAEIIETVDDSRIRSLLYSKCAAIAMSRFSYQFVETYFRLAVQNALDGSELRRALNIFGTNTFRDELDFRDLEPGEPDDLVRQAWISEAVETALSKRQKETFENRVSRVWSNTVRFTNAGPVDDLLGIETQTVWAGQLWELNDRRRDLYRAVFLTQNLELANYEYGLNMVSAVGDDVTAPLRLVSPSFVGVDVSPLVASMFRAAPPWNLRHRMRLYGSLWEWLSDEQVQEGLRALSEGGWLEDPDPAWANAAALLGRRQPAFFIQWLGGLSATAASKVLEEVHPDFIQALSQEQRLALAQVLNGTLQAEGVATSGLLVICATLDPDQSMITWPAPDSFGIAQLVELGAGLQTVDTRRAALASLVDSTRATYAAAVQGSMAFGGPDHFAAASVLASSLPETSERSDFEALLTAILSEAGLFAELKFSALRAAVLLARQSRAPLSHDLQEAISEARPDSGPSGPFGSTSPELFDVYRDGYSGVYLGDLRALSRLVAASRHPNPQVRVVALWAMLEGSREEHPPTYVDHGLFTALYDPAPEVASIGVQSVPLFWARSEHLHESIAQRLNELYRTGTSTLRVSVIRAARQLPPDEWGTPLLAYLERVAAADGSWVVRHELFRDA